MPVHEQRTRQINQLFRDGDIIDLRGTLGLDRWRYAGYQVDYVIVRVRNADPRSQQLTLMINGYTEDSVRPYNWESTMAIRGWKELDREIRTLELGITGWIDIDSITVYLTRNRYY